MDGKSKLATSLAVPPSGEVPATGRDVVPMDGTRTPDTKRQSKLEMSLAPSNSEISLRVGSVKREFSSTKTGRGGISNGTRGREKTGPGGISNSTRGREQKQVEEASQTALREEKKTGPGGISNSTRGRENSRSRRHLKQDSGKRKKQVQEAFQTALWEEKKAVSV